MINSKSTQFLRQKIQYKCFASNNLRERNRSIEIDLLFHEISVRISNIVLYTCLAKLQSQFEVNIVNIPSFLSVYNELLANVLFESEPRVSLVVIKDTHTVAIIFGRDRFQNVCECYVRQPVHFLYPSRLSLVLLLFPLTHTSSFCELCPRHYTLRHLFNTPLSFIHLMQFAVAFEM